MPELPHRAFLTWTSTVRTPPQGAGSSHPGSLDGPGSGRGPTGAETGQHRPAATSSPTRGEGEGELGGRPAHGVQEAAVRVHQPVRLREGLHEPREPARPVVRGRAQQRAHEAVDLDDAAAAEDDADDAADGGQNDEDRRGRGRGRDQADEDEDEGENDDGVVLVVVVVV
eukprot:7072924-Pyramimonas_sp.AAC.1